MKFFKTVRSTITNKDFYKNIVNENKKDSWKYYIKLCIVGALVVSIGFSVSLIPLIYKFLTPENVNKIVEIFPKDLTLTIKDGEVSTNQPEPYVIPIPKNQDKNTGEIKNLFIIDTKKEPSIETYIDSKSLIYITKSFVIYPDNKSSYKIQSLKNIPDFVLTKEVVGNKLTELISYVRNIAPFIPLALLVFMFVYILVSNLLFLVIVSFIVWIIFKIKNKQKSFGLIYRQGLYLVTPIIILGIVLSVFNTNAVFTLIYIIIYLLWYRSLIGFEE